MRPSPNCDTLQDALSDIVANWIKLSPSIPVIGLSGPQGSGKSTVLNSVIETSPFRIAGLGLDDFYLTKPERNQLACSVSALYEMRGAPGTHDLELLKTKLKALQSAGPKDETFIPKFDKPSDDRLPVKNWPVFKGRPDAILIEGWMVGAMIPPDFTDAPPLNTIEREDVGGAWRQAQAIALAGPYARLWDRIDHFVHIAGPGFDAVHDWRQQQEASNLGISLAQLSETRRQWVATFVQYFERLTTAMFEGHRRAGTVLRIDADRKLLDG